MRAKPSRRFWFIVLAASVVVVIGVTALAVAADFGSPQKVASSQAASPRPTDSASPAPSAGATASSPAPIDSDSDTDATAATTLTQYFTVLDGLSAGADAAEFEEVASGAALSELQAQLLELDANDWTLQGTPTLENLTVTASDPGATPPTATVQVCVDSSDVTVIRPDGELAFTVDPQVVRALNIFSMQLIDGDWRVVEHTFPDDADC